MKKLILILIFLFVFTSVPIGVSAVDPTIVVDLECQRQKLLDPYYPCEITVDPGDQIANLKVDNDLCEDNSLTCGENDQCFFDDINDLYDCAANYYDDSKCTSECPAGLTCTVVDRTNPSSEYICLPRELDTLNLFGFSVGPLEIFIPKILRLFFTVAFSVIGILFGWQFFSAIWEYTTAGNDSGKLEEIQKKIFNVAIGIFFIAIAILIVQIMANLFGASGNLFEFTYP